MKSALPLILDLSGRRRSRRRRPRVRPAGPRPSPTRERLFASSRHGSVRTSWSSSWAAGWEWQAREYAGAQTCPSLARAHGSGRLLVDRQVARDAEDQRIWCVDATDAAATAASIPARTDVSTSDGRVTISTYAAGDPGLATALRDGVADAVAHGAGLDLRRTRRRDSMGWVALVGGGPGIDGLLSPLGGTSCCARRTSSSWTGWPPRRRRPAARLRPRHRRRQDAGPPCRAAMADQRDPRRGASRGLGVVRLKGGDPYVLGRGGEERQACEAAGLSVEVVPGVTSAVSVPAAAGIPVTHRGVARGFTVVTGHEAIPGLPTGTDHTLVLLMGVTQLPQTVELLVGQGRPGDCPVAIVERGFAPTQRTTVGTLSTIAERALARSVESPAVIVVGDVVRLSPDWRADAD